MKTKNLLLGGSVLAAGVLMVYKLRRNTPEGVTVVKPFDLNRYLGRWYEIARFDFFYENNMDYVTAHYSLNDDGSVKVENRGYSYKKNKDMLSIGRAVLAGGENEGKLKVSFFGPFYSGYNVVAIDDDYKYSLVSGRNRNYLWILSREKEIPALILKKYLELAIDLGFDISKLVWTKQ